MASRVSGDFKHHGCADLKGHPLIIPCSNRTDPDLQDWFFNRCASTGFKPKIAAEASSPLEAFNLVQSGVGIAIVPDGVCGDIPRNLEYSPIGGIEALELMLGWRPGAPHRVQKIVAEIVNGLRRTNLAIAS